MKSAQGVEDVYWVMMGDAPIRLRVFMNSWSSELLKMKVRDLSPLVAYITF